jgi:hypothetical protein
MAWLPFLNSDSDVQIYYNRQDRRGDQVVSCTAKVLPLLPIVFFAPFASSRFNTYNNSTLYAEPGKSSGIWHAMCE